MTILPDQDAVAGQVAAFERDLAAAASPHDAQLVRDRYLGRKNSVVASWMQLLAAAAPDQKRELGRVANELKQAVEARWTAYLASAERRARPAGAVDVTLPGRGRPLGHRHPLTVVRDRMESIFTRMGFAVVEGPEIEDEWHNFDALNMPAEHPARDMQDTLYLAVPLRGDTDRADDQRTLLRTHTSSMQIRYMQAHTPPIRIVVPGRVYRRDDLDLTHTPMFTQMEGLVVGEGVSLADLKGTLLAFAREMFSATSRVRFRPSFFPYTEPSAEVDISCWQCDGTGCAMCKKTGWLEVGGCGMVHPAVFEAVGYDAERYTGFAWGVGVERVAILRHQVSDIRLFFENDLRFLEQFPYRFMRLLLSWVRDFVDVTAPAEEIADLLALRGFEVASIEPMGHGDAVIDFEVTANRPDCLSVRGFAREIATAYRVPLRVAGQPVRLDGAPSQVLFGDSSRFTVSLEEADLCPRYAAAAADVTPATSPSWMIDRLQAAGIRPISPIVDITNYVLVEMGHPMHAFDLATLDGAAVRVRRARPGERLTTLDGIERTLDPEMLVIADATRAQAVAGVMGGAASEVTAGTRTVVFESACFNPVSVRRTSKRLGLKTEASARFERGADINAPADALRRAVMLMQQVGAGRIVGPAVDCYPSPVGPRLLHLRRERLALVLGLRVPDQDVERILTSLGLVVTPSSDGWDVVTPTVRVDLLREIDLVEEVGRHFGFDKLEAAFPVLAAAAPPPDPRIGRDHLLRRVLTAAGFSEAVTFGFIEARAASAFSLDHEGVGAVSLANPLSAKFDVLRPSLIPGLVDAVAHNRRHGRGDVALFEIGARFSASSGETRAVALAWTGAPLPEHWSTATREVDFFDVKGIVEDVCAALGATPRFVAATRPFLVDGQAADVIVGGAAVGVLGLVSPATAESRGIPRHDKVFIAELDLDGLWSRRATADERVQALPRYPFVLRDISVVVSDTLPAEIIRDTIQLAAARGRAPLSAIGFFDRYKGKGVADDAVSVSVRLTFQAPDRTLTDHEVLESVDAIVAALQREHGAIQR